MTCLLIYKTWTVILASVDCIVTLRFLNVILCQLLGLFFQLPWSVSCLLFFFSFSIWVALISLHGYFFKSDRLLLFWMKFHILLVYVMFFALLFFISKEIFAWYFLFYWCVPLIRRLVIHHWFAMLVIMSEKIESYVWIDRFNLKEEI